MSGRTYIGVIGKRDKQKERNIRLGKSVGGRNEIRTECRSYKDFR